VLAQSWRFFPQETIFLAVVDPGVGTKRLPIAVESRAGARFLGTDNGLLWTAAQAAGVERIVELRAPRYRLKEVSATFHGRDIFAPAAAWLWCGVSLTALGPRLDTMVRLEPGGDVHESERELKGAVIYIDGFGNLVTNISREHVGRFVRRFRGFKLLVRIGRSAPIEIRKAYGDAPLRAPLATFGSFDMLEVAVRDGNAADYFAAAAGVSVTIRAKRQ
jgi:S-adenosyl-L-methionine hydrolase (adenosine-forming)